MNIFVAFNDGYALPTKVMLKSLIQSNPGPLAIYVLYSALEKHSIDSVRELEDGERVVFHFRKVEDAFLNEIEIPPRFSRETYYRLLAHRLFDEDIEKVLWLDGDMIITGKLSDFYDQGFQGKLFVAIESGGEEFREERRATLKMPSDSKYVNTGVMLLNLKEMREKLNDKEIVQYLTDNQELLFCADQDVFNGLLHAHFLVTDPERWYNFSARFITGKNRKSVYQNARVIHYAGDEKPWKRNYPFYCYSLWWKYAWDTAPEYRAVYAGTLLSHLFAKLRNDVKRLLGSFALFLKKRLPGLYLFLKRLYDKAIEK